MLPAIPIERTRVNRRSVDEAAGLLDEGWSVLFFPEGGRSPDGWTQAFRRGAAYFLRKTGRPVVPVHLRGVRQILPKRSAEHDAPVARGPNAEAGHAWCAPR